ncbi:MAG: SDR family NAD(P)-dependent oxidoreductase [Alphaproteobacteria bacterium]|nr:SDR family NAD(P)-dependent oxidoreductase [Alphaproteobacteria bacterium]
MAIELPQAIPAHPARANRLFCFGLGYSALALARRLLEKRWRVAGTCRTPEKAAELEKAGIEPFLFDRGRPLADAGKALAGTTHLLSSVPPDATGDAVLDHHANDLIRLEGLRWTGYLSTTGVYGDRDGGWVDEKGALHPVGPRGRARVAAEEGWLSLLKVGQKVAVFRLAGIYGPGRSALDTVREGKARRIVKPGQVFSRIHVDDIATILEASIAAPEAGAIYNVCDDEPAPPQDVIAYAAALLGREPPPEIPYAQAAKSMSEMARSFYAENKRVNNRKIKDALGVKLTYPDYREGLKALLAAGF